MDKPKIFAFINGNRNTDCLRVAALSEDGHFLAEHLSSNEDWAQHDIGINSDWKHEYYRKHYPDGYDLIWVEGNPKEDARIVKAYECHLALPVKEETE